MSPASLLATSSQPQDPSQLLPAILPALLILAAIVIVAWIVLVIIRRSMQRGDHGLQDSFSLEQLRKMHREGDLDDEEFEQARNVLLGHFAPAKSDTREPGSGDVSNSDVPAK